MAARPNREGLFGVYGYKHDTPIGVIKGVRGKATFFERSNPILAHYPVLEKQTGVDMNFDLPGAVPEIPVKNLDEAVAYYQNSLGFSLDWFEKELGLAGISKDNCRMFLANENFRKAYRNVGPILIWLNLDSKEAVDELHRVWNASKAKIVSPPDSKPWGLHEFTAVDLDGNFFRVFYDFATPERENA